MNVMYTHTHTFHSLTHTDSGTLNLYYLRSHERTILSVPFNIIIFLNKYFVIFIYKSIQTRLISSPTPPFLPKSGWLKRLAARGKVGMLQINFKNDIGAESYRTGIIYFA